MKTGLSAVMALLLILVAAAAAPAEEPLKRGDQVAISHKMELEASLHAGGGSAARGRGVMLNPGTVVKVLGNTHSLGKPWYEVESAEGRGFVDGVTLDRMAPSRVWLDKIGKKVALKPGQRFTTAINAMEFYVYTAPSRIETELLEVGNYARPNSKPVTRIRVEVSINQGQSKIKVWGNAYDLAD